MRSFDELLGYIYNNQDHIDLSKCQNLSLALNKLIKSIARELKKENINYMIIGGQAVLVHGEPRLTKDIDITLGLNVNGLEKILKIAKKLKFKLLVSDPEKFVKETFVLPFLNEKTDFRTDFIFSFSEYKKVVLKRVNKIKIDRTYVNFASVEDLIIHKNVDFDYVLNWLKNFEVILEENLVQKFLNLKREIGL